MTREEASRLVKYLKRKKIDAEVKDGEVYGVKVNFHIIDTNYVFMQKDFAWECYYRC